MGLFGKSKKTSLPPGQPSNVGWVRSPKNRYYHFLNLEPEEVGLRGVSGVYVIWHAGLRPEWIYIDRSDDLAKAFREIRANREIIEFDRHGSLFVTWAQIRPEFQAGVVKYLNQVIPPIIGPLIDEDAEEDEDEDVAPITVFPPGVSSGGA